MKTLEEKLWDFIDGNLSDEDMQQTQQLINTDAEVEKRYRAFLSFNQIGKEIDLDEPSMSFTRNVMEGVAKVHPPISLKTKVDNRIVFGIAAFFGLALLAILGYSIYNSTLEASSLKIDFNFSTDFFENKTLLTVFLLVDLVIALLFIDNLLRKKLHKRAKTAGLTA